MYHIDPYMDKLIRDRIYDILYDQSTMPKSTTFANGAGTIVGGYVPEDELKEVVKYKAKRKKKVDSMFDMLDKYTPSEEDVCMLEEFIKQSEVKGAGFADVLKLLMKATKPISKSMSAIEKGKSKRLKEKERQEDRERKKKKEDELHEQKLAKSKEKELEKKIKELESALEKLSKGQKKETSKKVAIEETMPQQVEVKIEQPIEGGAKKQMKVNPWIEFNKRIRAKEKEDGVKKKMNVQQIKALYDEERAKNGK